MRLTSPAFEPGEPIPLLHAWVDNAPPDSTPASILALCQEMAAPRRANISPPLRFHDLPSGVKSLAVTMEDVDAGLDPVHPDMPPAPAGVRVHWVLFNLPPDVPGVRTGLAPDYEQPDKSMHGLNCFNEFGYRGPNPLAKTHRYYFRAYALDIRLRCKAGTPKHVLLRAMGPHILAQAHLVGTFAA